MDRGLEDCSPRGHKESVTTEQLTLTTHRAVINVKGNISGNKLGSVAPGIY